MAMAQWVRLQTRLKGVRTIHQTRADMTSFEDEDTDLSEGDVETGKVSFNILSNKIHALWNPSQLIQLMDIENDYFLVVAWIRLPRLPSEMHKHGILHAIGETTMKVIKVDSKTDKILREEALLK
ncbi:hypothetical protein Goarm_020006, partial [Gossypium armourianum]|nr:hypothetical protein [Gossypium armourianum]